MKKESNPMPPKDVVKPKPPPPPPMRKYKTGWFGILILQNQDEIDKWGMRDDTCGLSRMGC